MRPSVSPQLLHLLQRGHGPGPLTGRRPTVRGARPQAHGRAPALEECQRGWNDASISGFPWVSWLRPYCHPTLTQCFLVVNREAHWLWIGSSGGAWERGLGLQKGVLTTVPC